MRIKNTKSYIISLSISLLLLFMVIGVASAADSVMPDDTNNNISTYSDTIQMDSASNNVILEDEQAESDNVLLGSSDEKLILESGNTVNLLGSTDGVYYVKNNTDTYIPDGSQDKPYKNITDAVTTINGLTDDSLKDYTINIVTGTYKENGISIEKNITFNGTGDNVIINGQEGQIFTTPSDSDSVYNVKFINLTLTNASVTGNGSVLNIKNKGNLEITDCMIENNTVKGTEERSTVCGGAIYINNGNVTVYNSKFTNNTAKGTGYNMNVCGGAIYINKGNVTVYNSKFTNNTINASNFEENSASRIYGYGGAISVNNGTITITSSNFTNNTVNASSQDKSNAGRGNGVGYGYGGAISINNYGNVNVTNTNFINNTVKTLGISDHFNAYGNSYGGAIYNHNGNVTVNGSCFLMNNLTATATGKNTTIETNGSAIYIDGNVNVEYSVFLNNTCSNGNVLNTIYVLGTVTVNNNWWGNNSPDFDKNKLIINKTNNGVIPENYVILNAILNTSNNITVEFKNSNGNSLNEYIPSRKIYISIQNETTSKDYNDDYLTNNTLTKGTGIIYNSTVTVDNQVLYQSLNTNNDTDLYVNASGQNSIMNGTIDYPFHDIGSAVQCVNLTSNNDRIIHIANGTYHITDTMTITKNITFQKMGEGEVIINGHKNQIFTTPSNSDSVYNVGFNNLTLTNASATGNGSVLNIGKNGNVKVTDCYIENNAAKGTGTSVSVYGGAISVSTGNVTVTNSSFTNNTVNTESKATGGDAYNYGYGGAIYVSNGNVTVNNSNFTNNTVNLISYAYTPHIYGYGGAISVGTGNVTVNGSYFIKNKVTTLNSGNSIQTLGGAIYIKDTGNVNVEYSVFLNNTCSEGDVYNTIHCPGTATADTNWWGTNTPDFTNTKLIMNETSNVVSPNDYVIMTLTLGDSNNVNVTFTNSTGDTLNYYIPSRPVSLTSTGASLNKDKGDVYENKFTTSFTATPSYYYLLSATVDNQQLTYNNNQDLYVNVSSKDTIIDGTQDHPYHDIASAVECVNQTSSTDRIIHIAPGTYQQTKTITLPEKNINFTSTGSSDKVIITGNGKTFYKGMFYSNTKSGVTFNFINLTLNNATSTGGAAISMLFDVSVGLINCTFENNKATETGGGAIYSNMGVTVTGSSFINNTAKLNGGAIYTEGSVNVTGSCFVNNTASTGKAISANTITDVSGNWWGNNTPFSEGNNLIYDSENNKYVSPADFVTVNVTSSSSNFIVEFLNNNTGEALTSSIPIRPISLNSTTGVIINPKTGDISNNIFKSSVTGKIGDPITVTVDNEVFDTIIHNNTIINTTSTIYSFIEGSINMVNVTLYDVNGENITKDKTIYYTIDGVKSSTSDGGITISGLSLGPHSLKFYFEGDTEYIASENETTINIMSNPTPPIPPTATVLTGEDLTTSNSTVVFSVTLKTVDGDVLGNESVLYILYNDEYHPVTTDSNGVATVTLNNLTVGSYSIRYVYFGNNQYASSNGASTINVVNNTKADSNLKTGYESNVLSFNLTSEGQPLAGQNITVNINGTQITLTTDKDGLASINLNNYTSGNYTVNYKYLGNEKVNGVNGTINLTVTTSNITDLSTVLSLNNFTETYGQALNLTGTLLDLNGKPVIGMHIALNLTNPLNGASKIYSATTDNKGEYQLEINLYPGEYSVSASFNGLKTNTTNYLASGPLNGSILVNKVGTVLTANKFQEKYGAGENFTGKLLNTKGEAVIGQHISLKLSRLSDGESKVYWVTTDTNGEYQLPINLFKGEYTAECTYSGTSIYTTSDASTSITVTA